MLRIVCTSSSESSLIVSYFAVCQHLSGLALQMQEQLRRHLLFLALTEGGFIVATVGFADVRIIVGMSLLLVACRPYSVGFGICCRER